MNKALRVTLIVLGMLVVATGLVFAGAWIGRNTTVGAAWRQPAYWMMNNYNHRGPFNGQGMMGGYGNGYGMMGGYGNGNGMMGSYGNGYGMMGGYGYNYPSATPLEVDQAYQAAETYLASLNLSDLKIAEVMVFDNNAYVRVIEQSTGIGAFELLVDPTTLAVYPEHGPNMMWNLKYAGVNHQYMMGGRGGMMGNAWSSATPSDVPADLPVSADQALEAAQQYLNTALPGTTTAADADPFYGYYTIDFLRDGNPIGMLSVNGFNSQVFMHTWHGTFISAQDY